MALIDKLLRRKGPTPRLAGLISSYPPYVPPVVKAPRDLNVAEAEANLADLLRVRPERLARYDALLAEFGISLDEGLALASPGRWLDALSRWTVEQWPSIYDAKLAAYHARRSELRGHPVFGLLTDTGLALGETILRHRPDYHWALDRDRRNREMASYRQPCVIRPAEGGANAVVFHAEDVAEGAYASCRNAGYAISNGMKRAVMDCISGAHERPPAASAPQPRGSSTVYDNADYHTSEPADAEANAEWGAAHLGLFVAWAANHDLLTAALRKPAAALKARSTRPLDWLFAHRDGRLAEADLTEAGNLFARYYYGTPTEGLRAGEGTYLEDFIATLKGGNETALVDDSWENYDRLAPIIDQRYAAFIRRS
jgi:hypothetical protein